MRTRKILLGAFAIALVFPLAASAQDRQKAPQDVLRFAPEVVIDDPVSRDVIAAGGTVVVNESVAGDVIALGGAVIIRGTVAGDVRAAGGTVRIEGAVGGNVAALGGRVSIAGDVAGDVNVRAELFEVPGTVAGEIVFTEHPKSEASGTALGRLVSLISLFGMLVAGLVLVSVAPKSLRAMVKETTGSPWRDFLWGALLLVATPLTALFLALTVIGIPLALVLIAGYFTALYASKVVLGVVLGTYVMGALKGRRKVESSSLVLIMVMGVAAFWLVTSIPVLGPFLAVVGIVWGLGLLIRTIAQVARRVGL